MKLVIKGEFFVSPSSLARCVIVNDNYMQSIRDCLSYHLDVLVHKVIKELVEIGLEENTSTGFRVLSMDNAKQGIERTKSKNSNKGGEADMARNYFYNQITIASNK